MGVFGRTAVARAARLSALVAGSLALAACSWFGPTIELPKDKLEAAQNPAIGSRALLRANQAELEMTTWQPAIQSLIDAQGESLAPNVADPLRAAVRRAYGGQRLFDRAATSLADDWDSEAALTQLEFLDTRVGQKILRARALRRNPAMLDEFREFSRHFALENYAPVRVELLRRLDRALLVSKGGVLVNRAVMDGALAALSEALPGAEGARFRQMRAQAAREEPQLYPEAADQVLRWYLFAFNSLSDEELARYAQFAESPAGQWYVIAESRALRMAANGAGEDLFQGLRPRDTL
ncbi:MAG TPA: hypothetical protein VEN47_06210 [Myxococcota bacterium]|nr:hypothetical protein [Myxococcota bacterium]